MSGFTRFTTNNQSRLKQTPSYRKGARGPGALDRYARRKDAEYYGGRAVEIRNARFARSNQLNIDSAVRSERERVLSNAYWNARNPHDVQGVHGAVGMKLSGTSRVRFTGPPGLYRRVLPFRAQPDTRARPPPPPPRARPPPPPPPAAQPLAGGGAGAGARNAPAFIGPGVKGAQAPRPSSQLSQPGAFQAQPANQTFTSPGGGNGAGLLDDIVRPKSDLLQGAFKESAEKYKGQAMNTSLGKTALRYRDSLSAEERNIYNREMRAASRAGEDVVVGHLRAKKKIAKRRGEQKRLDITKPVRRKLDMPTPRRAPGTMTSLRVERTPLTPDEIMAYAGAGGMDAV